MLEEYLKEDLIILKDHSDNRNELYKKLSELFLEKGYVLPNFYQLLSNREDQYPTGLQMNTYNIAIPHARPESVKQSFIAIVTLDKGIEMQKMEDKNENINVDVFFILGLEDGRQHIEALKEISWIIQQEAIIRCIQNAKDPKEVIKTIRNIH